MHWVLIRRGEANFGPLAPDEVVEQYGQGLILPDDEGWYEGLDGWLPLPELIRHLAPVLAPRASVEAPPVPVPEPRGASLATHAQVVRLRALGVVGWEEGKLTREAAAARIAKAEESSPAGRVLLGKMERLGLKPEPGLTIAEARRRLESAMVRHCVALLREKGIAYAEPITAAEAEELVEAGPPSPRQLKLAGEMGLRLPPNIGQRSLDRLLQEAEASEAVVVDTFFGIAIRSAGCRGITRQQVRDVIRYLNGNFPGWREQDGERRFFSFVAKFYPHLSGDTPTTQGRPG